MSLAIGVHVYYLPFYFQSVLGTSAWKSGINTLPYLMALLLSPMLSGSLISVIGYYVPLMLAGCTLMCVGSGFLFTLTPASNEGQWVGYQFLTAFGAGICRQIAFSAVPLVLPSDDLATASAFVALSNSPRTNLSDWSWPVYFDKPTNTTAVAYCWLRRQVSCQ